MCVAVGPESRQCASHTVSHHQLHLDKAEKSIIHTYTHTLTLSTLLMKHPYSNRSDAHLHFNKGQRVDTLMLLFKNRQNGRELRTNPWTFSHKGNFFFYSHWYSAASTEKKHQSRWGVFVLCMSEYLPGWGWQLGSSFFQSAFVDAAPAPSGQSLNLGCPMWRKQRHTLSLNLKKIHHREKKHLLLFV